MSDDPLDSGNVDKSQRSGDVVFTREPTPSDQHRIRMKAITPVYQCSHCKRHFRAVRGNDHMRFEIVLLRKRYYCLEHYQLARLELAYDDDKPYPSEWKEQLLAEQIARHPEWKRQDNETRTQYADRMIEICRNGMRKLNERVKEAAVGELR